MRSRSPAGRCRQRPADSALLERLARALHDWVVLGRPLMLAAPTAGIGRVELELAPRAVRLLTADLASRGQYDCALQLASIGTDAFLLMPAVVDEFRQDIELIARLALQAKLEPLLDLIDRLQRAPAAVISALTVGPFGAASPEPAKALWDQFLAVLKATDATKPVEPWRFLRNFAMHLSGHHGSTAGAASLLIGLVRHGEAVGVNPEIVQALRRDLATLRPGGRKRALLSGTKPERRSRTLAAALAGIVLVAGVGALALYEGTGRVPQGWFHALSSRLGEMAQSYPETAPPVGTGQHLSLPGVRYCHYQAARLEIIKQAARSPEDVRAFNLLVVDYNSRCSDFFYQDKDLAQVNAEVAARRTRARGRRQKNDGGLAGTCRRPAESALTARGRRRLLPRGSEPCGRASRQLQDSPVAHWSWQGICDGLQQTSGIRPICTTPEQSCGTIGIIMEQVRTGSRRGLPERPGIPGRDGATGCAETAGHDRRNRPHHHGARTQHRGRTGTGRR